VHAYYDLVKMVNTWGRSEYNPPSLASKVSLIHKLLTEQLVSSYGSRAHSRTVIWAETAPHDWSTACANHTALKQGARDCNHSCAVGSIGRARIIFSSLKQRQEDMDYCQAHEMCDMMMDL